MKVVYRVSINLPKGISSGYVKQVIEQELQHLLWRYSVKEDSKELKIEIIAEEVKLPG